MKLRLCGGWHGRGYPFQPHQYFEVVYEITPSVMFRTKIKADSISLPSNFVITLLKEYFSDVRDDWKSKWYEVHDTELKEEITNAEILQIM